MSHPRDDSDVARAIKEVAEAFNRLGTADANTPMGAIELLAKEIGDGTRRIADALDNIATQVGMLVESSKSKRD